LLCVCGTSVMVSKSLLVLAEGASSRAPGTSLQDSRPAGRAAGSI
jgi:hypothetical protein